MNRLVRCLLFVLINFAAPATVDAQAAPAQLMIELRTRDRWLLERQQPRHVPSHIETLWIRVDSVARTTAGTIMVLGARQDRARVDIDASGSVRALHATFSERPGVRELPPGVSLRQYALNDRVRLPEFALRELVLAWRLPEPRVGARWSDTIAIEATRGLTSQRLAGVRTSRIVGDTMLDGRPHWIVRDSLDARYGESWGDWSRTLDTLEIRTRTVSGTIRGSTIIDATTGFMAIRYDTTTMAGVDELRLADGRVFRAAVTYTGARDYATYDPQQYVRRQEQLRADNEFSIIMLPRNDLEQRVMSGDAAVIDSLVDVFRRSNDADARMAIAYLLARRGSALQERLTWIRREQGDTAAFLQHIADAFYDHTPHAPTLDELRTWLDIVRDPARVFAFGVDHDPLFENPRQALLGNPPVLQRDTARWPCAPQVCALLASQRDVPGESRLRDLALIMAFTLDPARWAAAVVDRADDGVAMLEPAAQLARGVGATWLAAAKAPLPPRDSDWRAWAHWMSGQDSAYRPLAPPPPGRPPPDVVRFGPEHQRAIRFAELISGRDVTSELQRGFTDADTDSARLVFGSMLIALGEYSASMEQLVQQLRDGTPEMRALARRAVEQLVRDAPAAPPDIAADVIQRVLSHVVEKAPAWLPLSAAVRAPPTVPAPTDTVFVQSDALLAGVRLPPNAQTITPAEWSARSPRAAASLVRVLPVRQIGPFTVTGYSITTYMQRAPDQAPRGYAQGESWILLRAGDNYYVVSASGWIT